MEVTETLAGQWRWRLFDAGVEVSGGAGYDTEWEAEHEAHGAQEAYTAYSQACQFDLEQYTRLLVAERPAFYRRVMEALGQQTRVERVDTERVRVAASELRRRIELAGAEPQAELPASADDDTGTDDNASSILAQFRRLLARRRRFAVKNPDSSGQAVPHAIDQILHALTWLFPAAEGK